MTKVFVEQPLASPRSAKYIYIYFHIFIYLSHKPEDLGILSGLSHFVPSLASISTAIQALTLCL